MHTVQNSNNIIEGFERLLKNIHLNSFMYKLILPFETCQYLFKRCSLLTNKKITFSCHTFIKHLRYVITDNKLHNGMQFGKNRALQL